MDFEPTITGLANQFYYYDRCYDHAYQPRKPRPSPDRYAMAPGDGGQDASSGLFAPLLSGMMSDIDFGRPYLNKDLDPVSGLFQQRTSFGRAVIEDMLADMAFRYALLQKNLSTLDYQICTADSELMQLPYFRWGVAKDLDKVRMALESRAQELEVQKLDETRDCWKDITRIKADLVERLQEYALAQSSGAFLAATGGEPHY